MKPEPIVKEIDDNVESLTELRSSLPVDYSKLLFISPTVYIHSWKYNDFLYDAYVGEANDVLNRTRQHYSSSDGWHREFKKLHDQKRLLVIGHPHFNKSLTLDVENRLIQYMSCMKSVHRLRNGRGNPQRNYFPVEEFEDIFHSIWGKLHEINSDLFAPEEAIRDSALFKCSPLHRLTDEQHNAKRKILDLIGKASKSKKTGRLIFVEGEAGTGKSVLMSSLFYDLVVPSRDDIDRWRDDEEQKDRLKKCKFIINHNEQLANFNSIFRRLGLSGKDDVVLKPATFIHNKEKVDVAFIDEAHLLCTQGNQGYSGDNQLRDIMKLAKITVIIFDEHQILTREQYLEQRDILRLRNNAKKNQLYFRLEAQLRINASDETKKWIDQFSNDGSLLSMPSDPSYDLKIFASVAEMYEAILKKSLTSEGRLSRVIASYDWEYNNADKGTPGKNEVRIGQWHLPWNYVTSWGLGKDEKLQTRDLSWAEQPHTIGEVGSTFTIQGFDLTYSGVILGPSISWDKKRKKILIKGQENKYSKVTSRRTLKNGTKKDISAYLVQHELRVLMTRGVKGMYIYAVDDDLRNELLRLQNQKLISL